MRENGFRSLRAIGGQCQRKTSANSLLLTNISENDLFLKSFSCSIFDDFNFTY